MSDTSLFDRVGSRMNPVNENGEQHDETIRTTIALLALQSCMPLDIDELELSDQPVHYSSPAALLKNNPDKAYSFEEIAAKTEFPLTRVGLQLYLSGNKTFSLVPKIRCAVKDGKEYYFWKSDDGANGQDTAESIPVEASEE